MALAHIQDSFSR